MKKALIYIPLALQFTATLVWLSVVCVSSSNLPAGEQAKHWWWLAHTGVVYMGCMWLSLLFYPKGEKMRLPSYAHIVSWVLILLGGWQAIVGLRQLYGFAYSNHSLFALTGTFYNPGPYSGYLALVFPLCLHEYYRLKAKATSSLLHKAGHYLAGAVALTIACVLPAGMSRSAWLAAGVSGLCVAWYHYEWGKKLTDSWHANRKKMLRWGVIAAIGGCIAMAAVFYLKKDSANGRLFMWKIGLNAIAEQPLTGYGRGGFPSAYGAAQEAYFANDTYAAWEEHVAGTPEYAFNEYLQIAIEWGIPALLLCLAVVAWCLWRGIRTRRIGACGGVLSLAIFSFSSYPLQLPVFVVTLAALLFACAMGRKRRWLLLFSFGVGLSSLYLWTHNDYEACRKWTRVSMLYHTGAYHAAEKEYAALYPALCNRAAFMFEYAHCLHKLELCAASNDIFEAATLLTCDPMVLNVMGKNYQMQGQYEEAEHCFRRAIHRLPGRIYPYYLLAKLYAEPEYLHPEKFAQMADMVMTKEPKVQSTAIREMREEIERIRDSFTPSPPPDTPIPGVLVAK